MKYPHTAVSRIALVCALAPAALAQTTTRVSVDSSGAEGNLDSYSPSLSATGLWVAFYSEASNLVPGDTNGADDIFIFERSTGTTVRVSVDSTGAESDGDSYDPNISTNGRFVAFYSEATNLVPGDTNGVDDIFLHERSTGITSRISVDSSGAEGNGASYYAAPSATARFVAFHSLATNLVTADTNGWADVFVHDRTSGVTTRVSVDSTGVEGNNLSEYPSISADGRYVLFQSRASNLVPGDANGVVDIFVRDRVLGTTTCVSVDPAGVPGNLGCGYSAISGDGRVVAFMSAASNLVPGDTNQRTDVFARDLAAGLTDRVSVSTAGVEGNNLSQVRSPTALSYDGRFVAFKSDANNLVPGDTNNEQDIFLRDRLLGLTTRMSVSSSNAQAAGRSSQPTISSNGRLVGFYSFASNLVPGDTNAVPDVFVRRW
jgi:hypothetical protein